MNRIPWRRTTVVAVLVGAGLASTGCIAVSRSARGTPPPAPIVWEVAQEWTCDFDDSFDIAGARAALAERIDRRALDGWAVVDFEIGQIRTQTCLVATLRRPDDV